MSQESKATQPTPISQESNTQLGNGQYVVGLLRGIAVKEGLARQSGNPYRIVEIVMETDNFNVSRFTLTKAQLEAGWESKINETFVNKTVLIAVNIILDNGYLRSMVRGSELPKILKS